MWTDEIVAETRRVRDTQAAQFNYEVEALYRDLKAKEQASRQRTVSFPSKRPMVILDQPSVKTGTA